jgi:adenine-specific DNA methylase
MLDSTNEQCPNEGFYHITTFQKDKQGILKKFNEDVFCADHSWEFAMYYSNYLGLKVIVNYAKIIPDKVDFI